MKSWKVLASLAAVAMVGGLAVPVTNYMIDEPVAVAAGAETGKVASFAPASDVFRTSCLPCHSANAKLPWYANMPVASSIIQHDIDEASAHFDMMQALYMPGQPPSAVALAKIEHQMHGNEMPPFRFYAAHWKAALTTEQREAVLAWVKDERLKHYAVDGVSPDFANEPVQPLPAVTGLSTAKVALGSKLFHETMLSGDGTLSCASCHDLAKGGTDQSKTSTGIGGAIGPINAPTVYNSAYNLAQFWDGRAADLQEQALGPVTNPIEMGGNWDDIIPALKADAAYRKAFREVYGGEITKNTVANAIAAFEETLVTPAPFDDYLKGDKTALTEKQRRGYELFKSVGCASCHVGPTLGGQSYEKMGPQHDYFADRGTGLTDPDMGRFAVTQNEADKHKFKVPTLRNVPLTGPYYHDGNVESLEEAVDKMAYYQLDRRLTAEERELIVEFLHSLTGSYNGKPLGNVTVEGDASSPQ